MKCIYKTVLILFALDLCELQYVDNEEQRMSEYEAAVQDEIVQDPDQMIIEAIQGTYEIGNDSKGELKVFNINGDVEEFMATLAIDQLIEVSTDITILEINKTINSIAERVQDIQHEVQSINAEAVKEEPGSSLRMSRKYLSKIRPESFDLEFKVDKEAEQVKKEAGLQPKSGDKGLKREKRNSHYLSLIRELDALEHLSGRSHDHEADGNHNPRDPAIPPESFSREIKNVHLPKILQSKVRSPNAIHNNEAKFLNQLKKIENSLNFFSKVLNRHATEKNRFHGDKKLFSNSHEVSKEKDFIQNTKKIISRRELAPERVMEQPHAATSTIQPDSDDRDDSETLRTNIDSDEKDDDNDEPEISTTEKQITITEDFNAKEESILTEDKSEVLIATDDSHSVEYSAEKEYDDKDDESEEISGEEDHTLEEMTSTVSSLDEVDATAAHDYQEVINAAFNQNDPMANMRVIPRQRPPADVNGPPEVNEVPPEVPEIPAGEAFKTFETANKLTTPGTNEIHSDLQFKDPPTPANIRVTRMDNESEDQEAFSVGSLEAYPEAFSGPPPALMPNAPPSNLGEYGAQSDANDGIIKILSLALDKVFPGKSDVTTGSDKDQSLVKADRLSPGNDSSRTFTIKEMGKERDEDGVAHHVRITVSKDSDKHKETAQQEGNQRDSHVTDVLLEIETNSKSGLSTRNSNSVNVQGSETADMLGDIRDLHANGKGRSNDAKLIQLVDGANANASNWNLNDIKGLINVLEEEIRKIETLDLIGLKILNRTEELLKNINNESIGRVKEDKPTQELNIEQEAIPEASQNALTESGTNGMNEESDAFDVNQVKAASIQEESSNMNPDEAEIGDLVLKEDLHDVGQNMSAEQSQAVSLDNSSVEPPEDGKDSSIQIDKPINNGGLGPDGFERQHFVRNDSANSDYFDILVKDVPRALDPEAVAMPELTTVQTGTALPKLDETKTTFGVTVNTSQVNSRPVKQRKLSVDKAFLGMMKASKKMYKVMQAFARK